MDEIVDKVEYAPENTEFKFDVGTGWVRIWIDSYYMDTECPEDDRELGFAEKYGEEVARNALHCGRNYDGKDGSFILMCVEEFIMADEVVGLRERFEALRDGRSDGFDAYPGHGIEKDEPPVMQFTARREKEGIRVHMSVNAYGPPVEAYDFVLDSGVLHDLCAYFKRINEWFPPLGPEDKAVFRRVQGEQDTDGQGEKA